MSSANSTTEALRTQRDLWKAELTTSRHSASRQMFLWSWNWSSMWVGAHPQNGTPMPYYYANDIHPAKRQTHTASQKDIAKYCKQVMTNISSNAKNNQLCCMDFLINDIANSSLKDAMIVEQLYDNNRLSGLVYCNYKTQNLINSDINSMMELFEMHDQVFILKDSDVYKLHITKENVHKMFLNWDSLILKKPLPTLITNCVLHLNTDHLMRVLILCYFQGLALIWFVR